MEETKKMTTDQKMEQSAEIFAQGMLGMLMPVVQQTDERVQAVFCAQAALQEEIQRLSRELDAFAEQSQCPSLTPYVNKLARTKHRMDNIQLMLNRIRERLTRLERMYLRQ